MGALSQIFGNDQEEDSGSGEGSGLLGAVGLAPQNLIGNAGLLDMIPSVGMPGLPSFGLPTLPGLDDVLPSMPSLDDVLPSMPDFDLPSFPEMPGFPMFPTPEFPTPGMPNPLDLLPNMPDIPGLGPIFGPLMPSTEGLDDLQRIYEEEGFSGLMDPEGACDRMAAREELSSRFQVVADDFQGPRAGNQVTQDQYDEIVRQYSDIRLGRTDLQIDTAGLSEDDARAFRDGTMNDIADILQTESGRGLIGSLADAPGHGLFGMSDSVTTISRRNNAAGVADPSNANGGGTFGTSGYVRYVPGVNTAPGSANIRSDVTLYHELVHAHDAVYNTWNANPVTAATGGTQTDINAGIGEFEYHAAGLGQYANAEFSENRYRGERRLIGATNVGERTSGSETDDNMSRRDTYAGWSGPGPNPATIPAAPGTPIPGITPSAGTAGTGGVGDPTRIGQSTDDEHDHDHDH